MKLNPLNDKIIVKRDDRDTTTAGGIIIPDIAEQKVTRGTVVAVGRGKVTEQGKLIEPEVRVGEKVIFSHYSGQEIMVDGEKLLVIRADDVLCGEALE